MSPWEESGTPLDTVFGPPTLSEGAEAPALRSMHSSEQDRQEASGIHGTRENKSTGSAWVAPPARQSGKASEEGTFEGSRRKPRGHLREGTPGRGRQVEASEGGPVQTLRLTQVSPRKGRLRRTKSSAQGHRGAEWLR